MTLAIAVQEADRVPYNFTVDGEERGIYGDLMAAIAERTPLEFEYHRLPQKRYLVAFRQGEVQLELGVAQAWRSSLMDAPVSRYTVPIGEARDVLLFPRGEPWSYETLEDARDRIICKVRGYFYPGQHVFEPVEVPVEENVVTCVARGGVIDGGLLDVNTARYWIDEKGLPVDVGPTWQRTDVHIRVHVEVAGDVLPILNEAIEDMRADGDLAEIYRRYTGQS